MYLDTDTKRINVGGTSNGASIYYGDTENPEKDESTEFYNIPKSSVQE
jgi:hypothetical protein